VSRAVVLLSGGKDSAVALWWARQEYVAVTALSIHHADRPRQEAEAARRLAEVAGVPLVEVELPFVRSAGTRGAAQVPVFTTGTAYIPMRNLLYFAVAGYFAESDAAERVVAGQLKSDGEAYADATPRFFDALGALFGLVASGSYANRGAELGIDLPLITLSDRNAMELGRRLGVPFELSWSCLHDVEMPCHSCVSCRDRIRALGTTEDWGGA